jgi:hypothetical protein
VTDVISPCAPARGARAAAAGECARAATARLRAGPERRGAAREPSMDFKTLLAVSVKCSRMR